MRSRGSDGPVYLVGMMGVGKSVVGKRLATRLGRRFVDLDAQLEAREGLTVTQLFAERGETAFRAAEAELLRTLDAPGTVISTGGGVVTNPALVDHMRDAGTIVYLRARPESLVARLSRRGIARRPLLATGDPLAKLTQLLLARKEAYERAHIVVDTDGLRVDDVVARIDIALGAHD